jgi:hypothetical protein
MISLKNELFPATKKSTIYNERYLKVESLGAGSFGKIKKVKDNLSDDDRYKAIKIFFLDNV